MVSNLMDFLVKVCGMVAEESMNESLFLRL